MANRDTDLNILHLDYTRLAVVNTQTGEEIAVITDKAIITADDFAVKLTPKYD